MRSYVCTPFVTIFNKVAIQGKGPDGKRTRTPCAYQESASNCPFLSRDKLLIEAIHSLVITSLIWVPDQG